MALQTTKMDLQTIKMARRPSQLSPSSARKPSKNQWETKILAVGSLLGPKMALKISQEAFKTSKMVPQEPQEGSQDVQGDPPDLQKWPSRPPIWPPRPPKMALQTLKMARRPSQLSPSSDQTPSQKQWKIKILALGSLLGPKMAFKISHIVFKTSKMVPQALTEALKTSKMAHETSTN